MISFFTASAERLAAVVCAVALALTPSAVARAQASTSGLGAAGELVMSALGLLGVPYRYGGGDPSSGVDCSGLVRFAASAAFGLQLPRQAEAISRTGFAVARAELQPGDLVFFNTLGRPFSHVGIYIGNQQFVHAPAKNGQVRIEPMTQSYWRNRFNGARRLDGARGDEAPAVLVTSEVAARWMRPESAPENTFGLDKP